MPACRTGSKETQTAMSDQELDVVFTAPHPDDLEIGMGGNIARLAKLGYRVGPLVCRAGRQGHVDHGGP